MRQDHAHRRRLWHLPKGVVFGDRTVRRAHVNLEVFWDPAASENGRAVPTNYSWCNNRVGLQDFSVGARVSVP